MAGSHDTVALAMGSSSDENVTTSILDSDAPGAYPLAGFTYCVVQMSNLTDCVKAAEMFMYFKWTLTDKDARAICHKNRMVPLNESLASQVTA